MIQANKVNSNTSGTKYLEILSANPWIGALAFWAFSTSLIIWFIDEFSAVFVTLRISYPYNSIEPPYSKELISLLIGLDSPVSIASLHMPFPKTHMPSTGTPYPGYITSKSSTCSRSTSISLTFISRLIS